MQEEGYTSFVIVTTSLNMCYGLPLVTTWRTPIHFPEPSSLIPSSMRPEALQPSHHLGWVAVTCLSVFLDPGCSSSEAHCRAHVYVFRSGLTLLMVLCFLSDQHRAWHMYIKCLKTTGREEERKGKREGIQVFPPLFPGNTKAHFNQQVLSLLINISEVLNSVSIDRNNYQAAWGREKCADS